jgi:hypothetical protein
MTAMNDASAPTSGAVAHHTELAPMTMAKDIAATPACPAHGGVYR